MRLPVRRLVTVAGVACLSASGLCFASDTALRAAPLIALRLHLPIASPRIALESASPAPSASPEARSRPRGFLGEGPIVLKGDGTYQLALNRSNRNGVGSTIDNYATALSMVAERRTEQSAFSVASAFGYGGGNLSAGSLIVGYRTPRYGLTYGQVTGPSQSQLQIGGFARGLNLAIPVRNGDVSYLVATAQQSDQTTYRVYGLRREWNALGGFVSAAEYFGAAEQGVGRESITDIGYRRYGAKLSTDTEIAVSRIHGVAGAPDGTNIAAAFHADLQGKTTFSTLGLRFAPAGFQTLTGPLNGGFSGDLAIRRHSDRFGDLDIDLAHSDQRFATEVQHDNRVTLSGGHSWGGYGVQFIAGLDGTHSEAGSALQRTAAVTFSESIRKFSLFETFQATSVGGGNGGGASQNQLALGVSRQLLGGTAAFQFSRNLSFGGGSEGTGIAKALSYRRSFGQKLDAQITQSVQTTSNNGVFGKLAETSLLISRRLSPVIALQVGGSAFRQTGLGGGSGTSFQASLVGPFGFGASRASYGRANPNLPAVIRGVVSYSTSPNPFAYNASTVRGYNNALVILDGHITQRTDSSGEFEFRFVRQGTHTLRIDPATLAPGLLTDREFQSVQVFGGQTATVSFAVGNFAGVGGVVSVTEPNGAKRGLANVGIAIDGIQAVTTTADGHYAVGRLSPGAHTVEIVETTLPSTVTFVSDRKKTVTVSAGTSTPLNFIATPLGSIAGNVVAPSDGGFGQLVGLKNIYVVADPGDHAAITDDDGAFILDNMPPGTYTLTVDPDTIPEGLSVLSGPDGPLALAGAASLSGVIFKLGAGAKNVVYTFSDGKHESIQVTTDPATAPPGAMLRVSARTNAKDVKEMVVESDVFGGFPLRLEPRAGLWVGSVLIPSLAKGDYALSVTAHRKDVTDASALVPIDPAVPLFSWRMSPRNPEAGHTVRVTLKTLAPVAESDALLFEDGYRIVLPHPTGRVFTFDIRLWHKGLPYSATLLTKRGQNYPISLR